MADDFDIFNFGGRPGTKRDKASGPARLAQRRGRGRGNAPTAPLSDHSFGSESDGDEDSSSEISRVRRRHRRRHANRKPSTAAGRLLNKPKPQEPMTQKEPDKVPDQEEDSEVEILECHEPKRQKLVESSSSPSPSPLPSPPPPGTGFTHTDNKSSKILSKADDVLNRLLYSSPSDISISEYSFETPSFALPPSDDKMNLRVRCKGKVHKYEVNKFDPLSKVITRLGEEYEVDADNKVLLSHKTTTVAPTDSPGSLGLTTADIIDAVIMADSVSAPTTNDSQVTDGITIKVQTSSKHKMYSLAMHDPLEKVMLAFASELGLSISQLKFSFDGEAIRPSQTTQDLEMENDDCIDVTVI